LNASRDDLERALTDLGAHLAVTREPDLALVVRSRLAAAPARRRRPVPWWLWTRRSVAIAVALVLVASGIAVASYFTFHGVEIHVGETPPPAGVGAPLELGERLTLAQAREAVSFPIAVPAALGAPDEVYVARGYPGYRIALLYRPRAGLPEAAATKTGLLLFEFLGRVDRNAFGKFVDARQISDVRVGRAAGLWVLGAHTVTYLDEHGQVISDSVRLSDNVLLWQRGRVTFRLESALPIDEAIRIATSVR
jgi:hypothetical protein